MKDSIREMKVITSTMFSMKRGELRPYPKHANAFKSSTPRHRSVSCYCLNTGLYIWSISISHVHLIALWWPLIGIYGHAIAVSTYKYCSIIIAIGYCHYIIMLFFHIQYKVFFHTFVNIQAIAKDQRDLICGKLLIFV